MKRQDVRYALMRVKTGTAEKEHQAIYLTYEPLLKEYDFNIEGFPDVWDISTTNVEELVSGHIVRSYAKQTDASLFDAEGKLKE